MLTQTKATLRELVQQIEDFFWVETKDQEIKPFILNEIQRLFIKNWEWIKYNFPERPTRLIILKGRQFGFSTLIVALFFCKCLLVNNTRAAIISHEDESTKRLFRKIKFFADHFIVPPTLGKESEREYSFPKTNSYFYIGTAGARIFARGDNLTDVHCSEVAFWPNASIIMNGLIQAVGMKGLIIIETTANGFGNYFQNLWKDSYNNAKAVWFALFYKWTKFKEYEIKPAPSDCDKHGHLILTPEEKHLVALHPELNDRKLAWRRWKIGEIKTENGVLPEQIFKQEYPLCVNENTKILTNKGIFKIKDLIVDDEVLAKYQMGQKQNYRLITSLGYELECTFDHPILTEKGFKQLKELKKGDIIVLGKGGFGKKLQSINYQTDFIFNKIRITRDFAEWLGLFMGDGSFDGNNGCVSICCDGQEKKLIERVKFLMNKFFGGSNSRIVGTKNGGVEIRKSNKKFIEPFKILEVLEKRINGSYKRKVCLPNYIVNSPKKIVASFLRGLFEADGFIDKNGNRIILFSKYKEFISDVHLLLLNFGITSRLRTAIKNTNGHSYVGYELILRKMEVNKYSEEIGFLSSKKRRRLKLSNQILKQGARLKITGFKDQVETIERTDIKEVYDITTKNHEFVANGIVVHNCPQEAFISTANSPFSVDALQSYEPKAVIDSEDGWQIWKKPSGYSIMAIDSAEGLNNHDRSVIDIYDEHLEQVAQWAGWCDTDELADKAVLMGERYKSFIITEINNMGIATQGVLSKKYPKNMQYHREVFDKDSKTKVDRIGWRTGNLTRGRLVGDLATAVREHDIIFNSPETIDECLTFVKRNGKFQAEEGCNDDRVITAGLAVQGFIDRPPSKYILNPELKAEHEAEQVNAKWRQNKIKKAKIKRLRALRSS